MALDFHPTMSPPLLATAGNDNEVKLWRMVPSGDGYSAEFVTKVASLQSTVNTVRWAPDGSCLASAGDDRCITLIRPQADQSWEAAVEDMPTERRLFRGHISDVYDVCWSPDSTRLFSGSVDNSCILFDASTGRMLQQFKDHSSFVQGVAWDPLDEAAVSTSCDRTVRVFRVKRPRKGTTALPKMFQRPHTMRLAPLLPPATAAEPAPESPSAGAGASTGLPPPPAPTPAAPTPEPAEAKTVADALVAAGPKKRRLFMDEAAPTFFRRPTWTPDGSFLLVPTGVAPPATDGSPVPATHVYTRGSWSSPCLSLPTVDGTASVAVRCSPVFYKRRRPSAADTLADLPYRMVFAVASIDSVTVYDTEALHPIAHVQNLHYDKLTDVAWSPDGKFLMMSSIDGYCSVVAFSDGELGEAIPSPVVKTAATPTQASKPATDTPTAGTGVTVLVAKPNPKRPTPGASADAILIKPNPDVNTDGAIVVKPKPITPPQLPASFVKPAPPKVSEAAPPAV